MGSETSNFQLYKPDAGEDDWASEVNDNWDTIDSNLGGGGGADIEVQEDGTALTTALTLLNFQSGIIATEPTTDEIALNIAAGEIDHDALLNFVANEHVDHSSVDIQAGKGLTGGGDLTTTRTLDAQDVTTQTGAYTASENDIVLADASGGAFTVTLPSPSESVHVNIKKIDSSSNAVTVATPGSETIDGNSSLSITGENVNRTIVSDGTNYYII